MGLKTICDYCGNEMKEKALQVIEGEPVVDMGSVIVEQEEFHGHFCSIECTIKQLEEVE